MSEAAAANTTGDQERHPVRRLVRFPYLQDLGIVSTWRQLRRLQTQHGFPSGFLLSPNVRVWEVDEIEEWLAKRRRQSRRAA
jgi:hypothetical protein